MSEIEIRPTLKFIKAGAAVVAIVVLAGWTLFVFEMLPSIWIPAAVTLLVLWPFERWVRNRSDVTYLTADRLRSERGVLSKLTRNLMLSRAQDVGVIQSLGQRIVNVGDIWVETAGEASRVTLRNIDSPRQVADQIIERTHGAT